MATRITVRVIRRKSRQLYALRWAEGERIAKAKWGDEGAAYREAFELEQQLNAKAQSVLTWAEAADAYEAWHLPMYSPDHLKNWKKAKRRFEAFCDGDIPQLENVWHSVTQFASTLSRSGEVSLTTTKGYCQYLRSFLQWCHSQGWTEQPPRRLHLPQQRGFRGKGRPLTGEEFDRMIAALPTVVGDEHAASWAFLMRGLWHSSLRLGEAVRLHYQNDPIRVDLTHNHPMIRFSVEGDKGRRDRLLPATQEFSAMLEQGGRGYVFRPTLAKGVSRHRDTWSHKIGECGQKANIVVDRNEHTGTVKYASAHDLRRSCLDRMRAKLNDAQFLFFARHADIRTSNKYYLSDHCEAVAAMLWGDELPKNG